MYLGDSENDNPAFRKSDISIGIRSDSRLNPILDCKYMLGIRSDSRLNPILDCKYMLDFNQLALFLKDLMDNDFIFSEDLLPARPIK